MKSFFSLLLIRLGFSGDPDSVCISALPPWPLLFITGAFALLAGSILLRSLVDIAFPQTIVQRLSGSRSVTQWAVTATLVGGLAALIEAVGAQQRAAVSDLLHNMAPLDHPMTVTGLAAVAAGLLVAVRAMVLMQLGMFRRMEMSAGPSGLPTDGAYAQTAGFSFGGVAGGLLKRPGGGVPAMLLGAILVAYGFELLRQADLCL
jgi:hypothetical protein